MFDYRRSTAYFLCVTATLSILGTAPEAHAYRQTKTCLHPDERDPKAPTLVPNCGFGEISWPVSWPARRIAYKINSAGTQDLGGNTSELTAAMRAGVEAWNSPDCSDFEFVYEGETSIAAHNPKDRVNVVVFLDEGWPDTSDAIALTTTTMTQRGVLVDADIELNSQVHTFTITETNVLADVSNTIAHEAGHMLGLDHSSETEATMYYEAPDREIKKRDLHPDDIAGVCTMYSREVPESIYSDEIDDGGCCATLPAGMASARASWLLLLGLLLGWRVRRGAIWKPRSRRRKSSMNQGQ